MYKVILTHEPQDFFDGLDCYFTETIVCEHCLAEFLAKSLDGGWYAVVFKVVDDG